MPVHLDDLTLHAGIVSRRRSGCDWLIQPPSSAPCLPPQPSAAVIEADRLEIAMARGLEPILVRLVSAIRRLEGCMSRK
jgi:hypothetical protein